MGILQASNLPIRSASPGAVATSTYSAEAVRKAIAELAPLVTSLEAALSSAAGVRAKALANVNETRFLRVMDRWAQEPLDGTIPLAPVIGFLVGGAVAGPVGGAALAAVGPAAIGVADLVGRIRWRKAEHDIHDSQLSASDFDGLSRAFDGMGEYQKAYLGKLASEWSTRFRDELRPEAATLLASLSAKEVRLPLPLRQLTSAVRRGEA